MLARPLCATFPRSLLRACAALPLVPLLVGSSAALTTPVKVWERECNSANCDFGLAAGTAGDVNGDGYSDFLVGTPGYDGVATNAGLAYLYLGSASGLSPNISWSRFGTTTGEWLGRAVCAGGDVNGDGYDDILLGSPYYDGGQTNEGRVQLYYGGPFVDQTADWAYESNEPGALAGMSVAYAGDVNADGFSDFVVGISSRDGTFQADVGAARVYLGSAAGPVFDAELSIPQGGAAFGFAVAGAGDVNADGYDDILIAAPWWDGPAGSNTGYVSLFYGNPGGIYTVQVWSRTGGNAGDRMGYSLDTAGDFDGDGYADIAIGVPYYDTASKVDAGVTYVFRGGAGGPGSTPSYTWVGTENGALSGLDIGFVGDADGDGYGDLIIGEPYYDAGINHLGDGRAILRRGGPPDLWGSQVISGHAGTDEHLGLAVGSAGDVDGDGSSEFFVSAPGADGGTTDEGAVRVYHLDLHGTAPGATHLGESPGVNLGGVMDGAGDVNGDGYDDLIYGLPAWGSGAGASRVLAGGPDGIDGTVLWFDTSPSAGYGSAVAGLGDINNDGFADVAVAPGAFGDLEIYYGAATVPSNDPDLLLPAAAPTGVDRAVDDAGDVNGDGYGDVIVGYPYATGAGAEGGVVRVHLGGPAGLNPAPFAEWLGGSGETHWGQTVVGVGDANGDGFDDIAFGADGPVGGDGVVRWVPGGATSMGTPVVYAPGGADDGFGEQLAALGDLNGDGYADFGDAREEHSCFAVLWGGAANPTLDECAQSTGGQSLSIAGPGDLDGDGYSDIVAGRYAPSNERLYVIGGGPAGLTWSEYWTYDTTDLFASVVAGLGDVNGDGLGDAGVGSPLADDGNDSDVGKLSVFRGSMSGSLPYRPRQRNADGSPLALGGLTQGGDSFQLDVLARAPTGRTRVALEYQVAEVGQPFGPAQRTSWTDTGAASVIETLAAQVTGLEEDTRYRWRLRLLEEGPHSIGSRWMSNSPRTATLVHLRTGSSVTDAPLVALGAGTLLFDPLFPNPTANTSVARFSVPRDGPVRLSVYDVLGRRVRTLVDRRLVAGPHEFVWDGRDDGGSGTSSGVYFVRLEAEGKSATRKVVRQR